MKLQKHIIVDITDSILTLLPAGILSILVLHSEVFEETVVAPLILLPVLLNYDLPILQTE